MLAAFIVLPIAGVVAAIVLLRRRVRARQRAMAGLLDAADGLESRLRAARARIEAIAGHEHDADPVREALQEILRQRLWLQQHGHAASLEQLRNVRDSIESARARIEQQLSRLDQAGAPLP